jgi:hypothetical protein
MKRDRIIAQLAIPAALGNILLAARRALRAAGPVNGCGLREGLYSLDVRCHIPLATAFA